MRNNPDASLGKSWPHGRYALVCLSVCALLLGLVFLPHTAEMGENLFFTLYNRLKSQSAASDRVVVVAIDDETLEELGGWPWNRKLITRLVADILASKPASLAIDLNLHPPKSINLAEGREELGEILWGHPVILNHQIYKYDFPAYRETEAGGVEAPLPVLLEKSLYLKLSRQTGELRLPRPAEFRLPDSLLWQDGVTTGFSTFLEGRRTVNAVPTLAHVGAKIFPSLSLESVRRGLGTDKDKIDYVPGVGLLLSEGYYVPVDGKGQMLLNFHVQSPTVLSAQDLFSGRIDAQELADKFVFLGLTSKGSRNIALALGNRASSVEIWATATSNILKKDFLLTPSWGNTLAMALGVFFALLVALTFAVRLPLPFCLAIAALLSLLYPTVSLALFLRSAWWLPPVPPFLLPMAVFLPWTLYSLLSSRFDKVIPAASASGQIPRTSGNAAPPKSGTPPQASVSATLPTPPPRNKSAVSGERQGVSLFRTSAPTARESAASGSASTSEPEIGEVEWDEKGGLIRLGKYQILRKMASGSGGDVFEGVDSRMGRKVAIKTVTKNSQLNFDRALERFAVEAKAAGSLNHPNINIIYDFGALKNISFMVLEYLDGITLAQWMKTHPIPKPVAILPWIEQICNALDYAHGNHIIHRDLKPANLMLVNQGLLIKLLDFGIAKVDDMMLTQTGMTVGTPSYMSPEQLMGTSVGPASDQYGFAVVIYQLLSHKLPVQGTKIPELCNRILKNEIVPILEMNPLVPESVWTALRKALGKKPEDRYDSCRTMYHALKSACLV